MESSFNKQETKVSALRTSVVQALASNPLFAGHGESEAWLFRDDIGAPHGIKGYEEQVNSVGMHHGHTNFTSEVHWNTWNSAT